MNLARPSCFWEGVFVLLRCMWRVGPEAGRDLPDLRDAVVRTKTGYYR